MANTGKSSAPARAAVIDDDADVCRCIKGMLNSTTDFVFAGRFSNAADALAAIPQMGPDLVVMDIQLPDRSGIECADLLKRMMPGLKIVMLTDTHEARWVDASSKAGATAYLVKPFIPAQLIATLRSVVFTDDENGLAPLPTQREESSSNAAGFSLALSSRQTDVLRNLAKGLLYKEIASELGMSQTAVHKSQNKIFKKLGVSNRTEAVRIWFANGGD